MKYELAAIVLAILASPFWQPVYYNARQRPTSLDWLEMVVGWGFFAGALALCILGLVL